MPGCPHLQMETINNLLNGYCSGHASSVKLLTWHVCNGTVVGGDTRNYMLPIQTSLLQDLPMRDVHGMEELGWMGPYPMTPTDSILVYGV